MDWKQSFALVRKPKSKHEELVAARNNLDIPTLQTALDDLIRQRRRLLASGEDLVAIDARIAAAKVDLERAAILDEELAERLKALDEEKADETRRQDYARAQALGKEAEQALRAMPAALISPWLDFVEKIAMANEAIDRVNANLPRGEPAIEYPEIRVRGLPGEPREILKEERFERWCFDGAPSRPVGEPDEPLVVPNADGKTGMLIRKIGDVSAQQRVAKCAFVKQHIREARPAYEPLPITAVLSLPGLFAGQPEVIWRPIGGSPDEMLAEVKAAREDMRLPARDPRPPRREFQHTIAAPDTGTGQ